MASCYPQMENRANAERAIEKCMRKATHSKKGRMEIQKWQVRKVINSNASKRKIGAQRADKVWGWVAKVASTGEHKLKDKTTWTQQWLSAEELLVLEGRATAAWAGGEDAKARAYRTEMSGAVLTWLRENEEPPAVGPWKLRPQKLRQMLAAKRAIAKTRGGIQAIYAALTDLTAQGKVTLTRTPKEENNKGMRTNWKEQAVTWMQREKWVEGEEEAAQMRERAAQHTQETAEGADNPLVLVESLMEPSACRSCATREERSDEIECIVAMLV